MVSISNLVNSGLLLVGQKQYSTLASPQQASVDSFNILNFLGGAGPYIQREGYGIDTSLPQGAKLELVYLLSRHGERYPSKSSGEKIEKVWSKLQTKIGQFTGDLSFFNDKDYKFFITDNNNLDQEVSPKNGKSIFAGTTKALKDGAAARLKYNDLVKVNSTLPVFSTNSRRCFETSKYFARGFLGDDYDEKVVNHVIVDERSYDANGLTPRANCEEYTQSNKGASKGYDTSYLETISKRLEGFSGLEFSNSEIGSLFDWCAYELNVVGKSEICAIFSNEEYIKKSYSHDINNYYSNGPGNTNNKFVGAPMVESVIKLFKDDSSDNKVWFSFTHDTDIEIFLASLGITEIEKDLPVDYIQFPYPYQHAQIVPQSTKVYIEKWSIDGESYVRVILNEAVVPIPKLGNGPGFSTKFSDFEQYVQDRVGSVDFNQQCGNDGNASNEITFYWDYKTRKYDAELGNF